MTVKWVNLRSHQATNPLIMCLILCGQAVRPRDESGFKLRDCYKSCLQKALACNVNIVHEGVPTPPSFLMHPLLDPACPLFKIFVSPPLFSFP